MDKLTFISNLINSVAWPVLIIFIILILKRPIIKLIPFIETLKYKDFEIAFRKKVDEVSLGIAQELPSVITTDMVSNTEQTVISKLAEISPKSAVIEAWRSVEAQAFEVAKEVTGSTISHSSRPNHVIKILQKDPTINQNIVNSLKELRYLRNEAAHAPDFALSTESAINYASTAQAIAGYLGDKNKHDA